MRLPCPGAKILIWLLYLTASAGLMAEYSKAVRVTVHVVGKKSSETESDQWVSLTLNGERTDSFTFTSTTEAISSTVYEFQANLNKTYNVRVSESTPMGPFKIYFSGRFSDMSGPKLQFLVDDSVSGAIRSQDIVGSSFKFRARPTRNSEPVMHFGKAEPILGGTKNELHIGLGHTMFNRGVGKIVLRPESFENDDSNDTVQINDADFSVYRGQAVFKFKRSGTTITQKQALVPEGLVDVRDMSSGKGIVIKFYENGEFGTTLGSDGMYPTSGYSPFITYEITDPSPTSTSSTSGWIETINREFKVKRITTNKTDFFQIDETAVRDFEGEQYADPYTEITTDAEIDGWYKSGATPAVKYERHMEWTSGSGIDSAYLKTLNASDVVVDYKDYASNSDYDWLTAGYGADAHSVYYKNHAGTGTTNPYEYNLNKTGKRTEIYRYTRDNIGSVVKSAIGEIRQIKETFLNTDGKIITAYSNFVEDASQLLAWPQTVTTTYNGTVINKTTSTYHEERHSGLAKNIFRRVDTNYALSGESYTTTTRKRRWDESEEYLRDQLISVEFPDGRKTAYLYQKGSYTFNATTRKYVFTESATGTAVRMVTLNGKTSSPNVTSFDGGAIDGLNMEVLPYANAGRNTAEEVLYDSMGRLAYRAVYVYTSTGFQRMYHRAYTYNEYGYLVKEYNFTTNPSTAQRVYYEATYTDWRKTSETNADGIVTEYAYDDYDRVKKKTIEGKSVATWTTPGDIHTTYTRDAAGRPLTEKVHDPSSSKSLTTTYTYDTGGRIKTITDSAGLTSTHTYTGGAVTTVTHPNTSTTTTTLHKDGKISTVTGTAQPAKTYTYGYDTSGTYSGCLWAKEVTGSAATKPWVTRYVDWLRRPAKTVRPTFKNAGTLAHEYHYDNSTGQLTQETLRNGSGVVVAPGKAYWYDGFGWLVREAMDTNGNGAVDIASDHNAVERFWQYQKLNSAWYRYEGHGLYGSQNSSTLRSLESAYTKISAFTVGATGDSAIGYTGALDKFGNWTHFYTEANRSQAKIVEKTYIDDTSTANLLAEQTTYINGLEVDSVNAEGHLFSKHYDSLGRVEFAFDGRDLDTQYAYKTNGQLDWMEDSYGVRTTYVYNSYGEVSAEKNDASKYTRYKYDSMGRVTHVWGHVPRPVKYQYNEPLGRMTRMDTYRTGSFTSSTLPTGFSSDGDKTEWLYDAHSGLLHKKTDDAGMYTEYDYTDSGQLDRKRNPRGFWIDYQYYNPSNPGSYALPGALKKMAYPSPYNNSSDDRYTPDITYTYERHGGFREVSEGTVNKRKFTYDDWFEPTQEDLATATGYFYHQTNDVINYDYADGPAPGSTSSVSPDPTHEGFWGRLKSFNFKNDTTYRNTYTYDGTGRLDQIKADHSTATVFDYTYHAKANVVDYLQHGSYSQDVVYRSDSYLQDKLIHKWGTDLTKDQEARYTYDSLGRRSYEKTSGLVVEDLRPTKDRWGAKTSYNDRNELTGYRLYEMNASWSVSSTTAIAGTRQSYTLDHMGNRTGGHQNDVSGTYTSSNPHDGLNQYNTARGLTVDYDNAGNMTDYGTKDYVYDAEDRLVKVTVGTTHYKYKYDYLGRRIAKYTGTTLNRKFVYQGWNLIAELSSSGSVQRTFTWGLDVSTTLHGAGGVGGLLLIDDELTSKRYYPIYDGSRNITGLYDQKGALVASYEYDAFGRIILQSSGDYSDDNPFRFSTKYTDDETGLVYYGHRYYEPDLGRFINRDPIEEDGGLNLYGFVGNDPVNFYDYLGMDLGPRPNDDHVNEEADPRYPFTWASEIYQENGAWIRAVDLGNGLSGSVVYDPIGGEVSFDAFHYYFDGDQFRGDLASYHLDYAENFGELYSIMRDFEEDNHFQLPAYATYLERTLNQVILGDFTGDVTGAGTAAQALLGLTGLDIAADIRDISHNLINWEWTWKHAGNFGLNVVALAPGLGVIKSADEAIGLAKAASKKPVVIGENMKDRVIPKAKELDADYYKPRKTSGDPLKKNERWIDDKMREGREIIDLGPDPRRAKRSEYYEAEKKRIERRKYPVREKGY